METQMGKIILNEIKNNREIIIELQRLLGIDDLEDKIDELKNNLE